jgi:hypothetical protein
MFNFKATLIILILALLIQQAKAQEMIIKPGISAGGVTIGMDIEAVKSSWGKEFTENYIDGKIYVTYKVFGVGFCYDPSSKQIVMISIVNVSYMVENNGIRIGTYSNRVKECYICEVSGDTWWCYDKGIAFQLTQRGAVSSIVIYDTHFVTGKQK